jgi:hypothetical protein
MILIFGIMLLQKVTKGASEMASVHQKKVVTVYMHPVALVRVFIPSALVRVPTHHHL